MRDAFKVHLLNDDGIAKATALGEIFSDALDKIEALLVPAGVGVDKETARCLALVVTKLQEASFFAKRGIAMSASNQRSEP